MQYCSCRLARCRQYERSRCETIRTQQSSAAHHERAGERQEVTELSTSFVSRPAKINHVSAKKLPIFPSLLYHNLQTVYTNAIKSLSLLQNLMGYLLRFTVMGYHIQS